MPAVHGLSENQPNPFRTETSLPYVLPKTSYVTLEIIDIEGHRVRLLVDEVQEPGNHTVRWDGRDASGHRVGGGTYLCRMIARTASGRAFMQSREILLERQ